jgi:hypothetical protein
LKKEVGGGCCLYEKELDVLTAPTDIPEATIDTKEETQEQSFALNERFHQSNPRYKLKPNLLKKCMEQ